MTKFIPTRAECEWDWQSCSLGIEYLPEHKRLVFFMFFFCFWFDWRVQ